MAVMSKKTKVRQVESGTLFIQIPIYQNNWLDVPDENSIGFEVRNIELSFDGCDRYSGYDPENDIYYYWDIDENHPYLNNQ